MYVCPYPRRRNVMRRYWRRLRIHTLWNLYHESKNKKRTGIYRFICYTNLRGYFDEMRRKLNFWLCRCLQHHTILKQKRTGDCQFSYIHCNLRGIFDEKRLDEIFQEWDFLRQDIVVPIVTTYASRYVLCFQFHTK